MPYRLLEYIPEDPSVERAAMKVLQNTGLMVDFTFSKLQE